MNHPLRENMEVVVIDGADWVRCSRCRHRYCRTGEDWRSAAKTRLQPPTQAGALMSVLTRDYLLRQLYCPSCGVLLDTDFVEEKTHG